jgi:hypothetical protein
LPSVSRCLGSAGTYRAHLWNVSRSRRWMRTWTRRRASAALPCAPAVDARSRSHTSDARVRSAKSGAKKHARGSGSPEKPTFHAREPGLRLAEARGGSLDDDAVVVAV